jgi:uncharacterized protein YbcI
MTEGLLEAISKRLGGLMEGHYGLKPTTVATYLVADMLLVVMRVNELTRLERTLIERVGPDRVAAMRRDFQDLVAHRYREAIEELTGRRVLTAMSQADVGPQVNLMVEIFFLGEPIDGDGDDGTA